MVNGADQKKWLDMFNCSFIKKVYVLEEKMSIQLVPTCEAIKVAAQPPIIIDAAIPAKCPTTVPTNMKIEY